MRIHQQDMVRRPVWHIILAGALGLAVGSVAMAVVGAPTNMAESNPSTANVAPAEAAPTATTSTAMTPVSMAADLAAINQLRVRQEEAWARGDGAGYASIYAEDADLINYFGQHLRTRKGIAEGMQRYFDTDLSGTKLLRVDEQVRFVTPTTAIIVRKGCVLWDNQRTCPPHDLFLNTNIATKRDGEWLITSFQNTRVRNDS